MRQTHVGMPGGAVTPRVYHVQWRKPLWMQESSMPPTTQVHRYRRKHYHAPSGLKRSSKSMSNVGALLVSSACSDTTSSVGRGPPNLSCRACAGQSTQAGAHQDRMIHGWCSRITHGASSTGRFDPTAQPGLATETLQRPHMHTRNQHHHMQTHTPQRTCTCFQTFCLSSGCRCRAT